MTLLHYLGHSWRWWWCHCKCLSDRASAIKDIHLEAKEYASEEEMENQQQLFDVRPLSLPFFILFCYLGAPPLNCCIVLALLLWQFHAGHVASTHSHRATKKKRCRERKREEGMEVQNVLFMQFLHYGLKMLGGWSFSMARYAASQKMLVGHNNTNTLQQKRNGGVAPSTIPKWLHPHFYTDVSQK